jgi:serine/threonine protein kinase
VKVLDFGLAKALADEDPNVDSSNSPTMVSRSIAGVIMGTAAYMSPEQARGTAIDARTDIWAFGCVLYELLTSRPVFNGATVTDIIAKVIERSRNGVTASKRHFWSERFWFRLSPKIATNACGI